MTDLPTAPLPSDATAASLKDLTRALEWARENEAAMRLALDAASEFLWDGDLVTGKAVGSARAGQWLGYAPEEWPPDPWDEIVHPDDRALVRTAIRDAVLGATRTYRVHHRVRHKDGSIFHVLSTGVVIRDAGGKPVRFVGFVRDLTQQLQEEAHRLQAQKLESLGLLAGGIAHDFNNLLTVVTSSLELAGRAGSLAEVADPLQSALLAVSRATALTRQLLAYAGRAAVGFAPVHLDELIVSMTDLLAVSVSKRVSLRSELNSGSRAVNGDGAQMQQVVMNLITNAAEAIGDQEGSVTVKTESSGTPQAPKVRLTVTDTGSGIPPELQARIFDPFFSTKGSGRGLGLAVIAGIIKSHGGTLQLESALGKGTTFTVDLPAIEAPKPKAHPVPGARAERTGMKVLLVDDEALLRKAARKLLESLGCQVDEVDSGVGAVERLREKPAGWDFVLMDVTMPQMSGLEALQRIRGFAPTLPVVLSSGYSAEPPAQGEGIYFLPKPYPLNELESLISTIAVALRTARG